MSQYRKRVDEHFQQLVKDVSDQKQMARHEAWRDKQREKDDKKHLRSESKKQKERDKQRRKQEREIPIGVVLKQSLNQNELYYAVNKAVSFSIPPHIRDDVISSMILAVLEGDLAVDDIKRRAREFVTSYHREAGTYRNISVDAPVPGTEDLRLIDTLTDGMPEYA